MELTHQERIAQDYHIHQFELMRDTKQKLFEKGVGVSYQDLLRFRMCCDTRDLIQEVQRLQTTFSDSIGSNLANSIENISQSLEHIREYMENK